MNNPTAAMIVIGDEILSGRTRDSNMHYLAKELVKIGIGLQEVRIVSDVENKIMQTEGCMQYSPDVVCTEVEFVFDTTCMGLVSSLRIGIDRRSV